MIFIFGLIFGAALLAPVLYRLFRSWTGWVLSAVPAVAFGYLLTFAGPVLVEGNTVHLAYTWFPSMQIHLTFYVDGLSLLFGYLITGIGTLIVIYGGGYLEGDRDVDRFYLSLLLFMGSMLGVVLSSNLIALFIFWEGTSFTSYLLIGYHYEDETSRRNALQALLVTGFGGLAMFAGLLLLQMAGGSWELWELLDSGEVIRQHVYYAPLLLLILAGAFTKSAQFPFHFWLPNAMVAPTPVSAYLHSATMVKAGVYLLARLLPVLGGTLLWSATVTTFGAVTMVVTAWLALCYTDLKQILAYSTLLILGMLVMLIGMGTPAAVKGAVVMIIAHALYKGTLFMIAGCVDHEAGTRDVTELGGLFRSMPFTGACACLAALSMAGLPPVLGFIGKESVLEATLHFHHGSPVALLLTGAVVVASIGVFVASGLVSVRPFIGLRERAPVEHLHEAPVSMLLGPGLLSLGGVVLGLWPASVDHTLLSGATSAMIGGDTSFHLALFHGVNKPLLISAGVVVVGIVLYLFWTRLHDGAVFQNVRGLFGEAPDRTYDYAVKGLKGTAYYQTRVLQSGILRYYMMFVFVTFVVLVGYSILTRAPLPPYEVTGTGPRFYEWVVVVFMVAGAFAAVWARTKLAAIISLGITGFSVAMLYMLFSAPDLVITQFLVETLTVILIALVMVYLPVTPQDPDLHWGKLRDAAIAIASGACVTGLALLSLSAPFDTGLIDQFTGMSYKEAYGRNIVNVILVDFRALDTLGEITVLGTAAVGVYALIKLVPDGNESAGSGEEDPA